MSAGQSAGTVAGSNGGRASPSPAHDNTSGVRSGLVTQPQIWAMHTHEPHTGPVRRGAARRRRSRRRKARQTTTTPPRRGVSQAAAASGGANAPADEASAAAMSDREAALRQHAAAERRQALVDAQRQANAHTHAMPAVAHATRRGAALQSQADDTRSPAPGAHARHAKSFAARMWSGGLAEDALVAQPGSVFLDPRAAGPGASSSYPMCVQDACTVGWVRHYKPPATTADVCDVSCMRIHTQASTRRHGVRDTT